MKPERFMWLVVIPLIAIAALTALFLAQTGAAEPDDDAEGEASWTFLVYMMGDTNLEPYALDDLTEMASVGSSDDLNVVAMVDRSPDYSSDGVLNLDDWEDTKLFEVQQDEFVELADLGELNTGDPATLASFVETAVSEYPAENYALLLWDHGGGWLGMGADETDGEDPLELDEIAAGIDAGLAATGVDKLDMIGFDACLMATYEVVSTLAPYADYMVASEEVEPGHGWNYQQLAVIQDDPETDAPALASAMLEGYSEQAVEEGTESDITLGILDLAGVDDLQAAMSDVAEAYIDDPGAYTPELAFAQQDVLEFGRDPDPASSMYQIDLGGFLGNLVESGDGELATRAAAAIEALDAMVIEHVAGPATSASTGLSIYFPPLQSYFYDDYLGLEGVPTWPATLAEFFTSGALLDEASRAVFDDEATLEASFGEDGLSVFVPLEGDTGDSLVEASVAVGFERDGDSVYVLEMPADLVDQDGQSGIQAEYDLTYMLIGDGEDEHLVYQSIGIDPGTGHTVIDIPLDYVAPGDDPAEFEDALLSIVLDDDGTIVEEDLFARDASGTLGAFEPDPDGLLFPVALVSTADGEWVYERTGDVGIWADIENLEYLIETVEPGTELALDVSVRDYAGTGDYAVFAVTAE
ncbi:clostripain-related cysteine peptidase [Microbacterium sp. SSM24]|uniref:clostripain-related cysteine peptidase n=1 Tax=Microbacterium sp. SSM24 TaxID=2991714 RepID=UPI002226211D|nr:clostripain-related cysteine peptidase [Microbacterium sp. SSM24]MCW3493329.1 clostripain-related cysteine peptidase [Microbacterium sp. SSM24]